MWQSFHKTTIATVIFCCVAGCAAWSTRQKLPVLPPAEAPILLMSSEVPRTPALVSWLPPEVQVVDSRPASERYYYPGSVRPRRWRDGLSMLPMEAITPSIPEQLESTCSEYLGGNNEATVKIHVTSFQFVFDQRIKLRKESVAYFDSWLDDRNTEQDEREQQRQASDDRSEEIDDERRDMERQLGMEVDEPSLFDILFGDLFREAIRFTFLDLPRKTGELIYVKVKRDPKKAQTPQFILNGKREGLNCQLKATVLISYKDGNTKEIPVNILLHAPFEPSQPLEAEMKKLVSETVAEFGRLMRN